MNFQFEYLKHGKALCGKVFKRFVETFNFHNDFISNMKGDADLPTEGGHVNLDTTDPSHPIIRCDGCFGGGGGGGGSPVADKSCFRIETRSCDGDEGEEVETRRFLVDCYYNVGGKTEVVEDMDIEDLIPHQDDETSEENEEQLTVIFFERDSSGGTYVGACSIDELANLQDEPDEYIFALYIFSADGMLMTDLRHAPHLQLVEVI